MSGRSGRIIRAIIATTLSLAPMPVLAQTDSLQPPDAFSGIGDAAARSQAIFTEMGKVILSPRCVNCHPKGDSPLQNAGALHVPPVGRGPDGHGLAGLECSTCHGAENVEFGGGTGSIPGNPDWHLAPLSMAWEGKSLREICDQIKDPARNGGKSLADLQHHNAEDSLVGWGWAPGKGRTPAPGSQEVFGALTQAWLDTGSVCPD